MAYELIRPGHSFTLPAASAITPKQPVKLAGTSAAFFLPAATCADEPFGVNGAATAGASGLTQGEAVTIFERGNVVKAIAVGSCGVGQRVMLASTNGALGASNAVGQISASAHWTLGVALTPAAAGGKIFSLYVDPRKV